MVQWLWYLGAVVILVSIGLLLDYILHREYRKRKEEFDLGVEDLEKEKHRKSELSLENQQKEGDLKKPIEEMNKKKILIVEDEEIIAQLLEEILEGEGFEIRAVRDGVEGLERIKQNGYDVIISDFTMPRMKGDEFYQEVQKLGQDLAKRIIFVSGSINDFISSTGNRFLAKPFSHEQLIEVVKDLIASK